MKKAAILIDSWKLPIFERHLGQSGYALKKADGPAAEMITLQVTTTNLQALAQVVLAANTEAAKTGAPT